MSLETATSSKQSKDVRVPGLLKDHPLCDEASLTMAFHNQKSLT